MAKDRESERDRKGCAACWDALIAGTDGDGSQIAAARDHLAACSACQAESDEARHLGTVMASLADRIEAEASERSGEMHSPTTVDLLVRLARYEALHRRARRAFAASVGVAASVALVVGLLWAAGETREAHQGVPGVIPGGSALADNSIGAFDEAGPYDSEVASAIPVHGWIDLPSSEVSADSSVWWVVLNYGGR
ncbi:MAG: hypothetical protein JXQ73_16000 [Phycisphaerae bacterium]|nr:hypothetical protein [Phycisphaerae bacterium]